MKPVAEWDEAYVLSFPSGEFDWIEFKSARSLDLTLPGVKEPDVRNELSKQLSAFANSGGGTLVHGIVDPIAGQPLQVDAGGVSIACKGKSTKEWLEDVIPVLVEFPLARFNVFPISSGLAPSQISPGKAVFAIEVADSAQAPHQAFDKRYYARVGGKSVPIGHRFVLDIFGRRQTPKLQVDFSLKKDSARDEIHLRARCLNVGRQLARFVSGEILVPIEMSVHNAYPTVAKDSRRYRLYKFSNLKEDSTGLGGGAVRRYEPILPNRALKLALQASTTSAQHFDIKDQSIHWRIFADNAAPESGEVVVDDLRSSPPSTVHDTWYEFRS